MVSLSKTQKKILVGILLGDACLETQTKGQTWRLRLEHGEKQKHYLEHKYEIFSELTESAPTQRIKKTSRGDGSTINWAFSTTVQPCLRFYAHQFYKQNPDSSYTKKVPDQIAKWLTPEGLAYWYMDDGSMKSPNHKAVYFNTQGFSKKEVDLLCSVLQEKFNLQCKPKKRVDKRTNNKSYQIALAGGATYDSLREIIFPYLIPSMQYKFPSERKRKN